MTHMEKHGIVKHILFANKSVDPSNARDYLAKLVAGTKCECKKQEVNYSGEMISYFLTCHNCRKFARIAYELEQDD
jgi:hypothetical protein